MAQQIQIRKQMQITKPFVLDLRTPSGKQLPY